jgi:carboxyl-terminal processing protease
VIVGQRSFGKGTVQELIDLEPNQGVLKLTTSSYWRPSGKNIHRRKDASDSETWGVMPDSGYEVKIDGKALGKLVRWRQHRDQIRPAGEPPSPNPDDPTATYFDPQLARALEYVDRATGAKPRPQAGVTAKGKAK